MTKLVMLPWDAYVDRIGELPDGLEALIWREGDPRPDHAELDRVQFFVAKYMSAGDSVAIIDDLPALEVVQLQSAGFEAYTSKITGDLRLCNARGVHDASTAELGIGLILASLREIDVAARSMGQWSPADHEATSLADRTVLIVGYGSIGAAVERRLAGFEVDVLRVARTARPDEDVHGIDELDSLLPKADIVVLLTPATQQTHHLVDAQFLARMPDGALLVNIARGSVVDTDALVAELESGRLRAALDVTDPEPLPPGHPLWSAPNVLITPHRGGVTNAFAPRINKLIAEQLRAYAAGEPLANVVVGPGA